MSTLSQNSTNSTIIQILKEHWNAKKQIPKLAKVDLVKTFRGAALGWSWAIIKPIVTIFVYWFAFTVGLRNGNATFGAMKIGFFYWMIAGMIPWFYMSDMLTAGIGSIRHYSYLVTKMKFPISTVPTFVSISKLFINLCMMTVLVIIFWAAGHPIDIYYIQLPFYILLSFMFWTVWGLFGSLLSVISKDFENLVKSFVTAVFWLSGIMWDPSKIHSHHRITKIIVELLRANPVTYLVTGVRDVLIYKRWFWQNGHTNLYFAFDFAVMILLALWAYKRLRKDIPDVL